MKYTILKYAFVIFCVLASGIALLDISQRVQSAERELRSVERKVEHERENIRALKAEWAYLNDPARLEALVTNGLSMEMQDVGAITSHLAEDMGEGYRTPTTNEKPSSVFKRKPSNLVQDISYSPQPIKVEGRE